LITIEKEREGELIDKSLMKSLTDMLIQLSNFFFLFSLTKTKTKKNQ